MMNEEGPKKPDDGLDDDMGGWAPASMGCTLVVFALSAWFWASVIFVLYGFNPGGSPLKEGLWRGAILFWPSLMLLMLGFSVYYWWRRNRFRSWLATLFLMGACPLWFPLFYGLVVECITMAVAARR
jgi:hypothetical protein